jgi:hypothetical protein
MSEHDSEEDRAEELSYLKENRKYLRSKVTRLCNTLKTNIDDLDVENCLDYLDQVKSLKDKLLSLDGKISSRMSSEKSRDSLNVEIDTCEKYEHELLKIVRLLEKKLRVICEFK